KLTKPAHTDREQNFYARSSPNLSNYSCLLPTSRAQPTCHAQTWKGALGIVSLERKMLAGVCVRLWRVYDQSASASFNRTSQAGRRSWPRHASCALGSVVEARFDD